MSRHLQLIKPSGRGLGYALPSGQGQYLPLVSNYIPHHDDFLGAALDSQEWVSSAGSVGTAVISVTGSYATITGSTATAQTIAAFIQSAMTARGNMYTVPFRVTVAARQSDLTSGQLTFIEVRDTGNTHLARFCLNGTAKTVATGLSYEVQAGSTAAAYVSSGALNFFATAGAFTVTAFTGYTIEMLHDRVSFYAVPFGVSGGSVANAQAPQLLKTVTSPLPRIDKNYYIQVQTTVASSATVAGTPNTVDLDWVNVEQFAPEIAPPSLEERVDRSAIKAYSVSTANFSASAAGGLVTSGPGVFLGWTYTTTAATASAALYIAAYDAATAGSGVYDFAQNSGLSTAQSRLLWIQQIQAAATGGNSLSPPIFPAGGIPFYKGLIVGDVTIHGTAVGASAVCITVIYKNEP